MESSIPQVGRMSQLACYIGCPLWAHARWRGTFFTADARREDFLSQYADVFGTAEGNSTFYGLPTPDAVARWADTAPESFRFSFKFPRTITHDRRLVDAEAETLQFFERLAPLTKNLGPFFLQLHASFGPNELTTLDRYLARLPQHFSYAVEVRHAAFFAEGPDESSLDEMLRTRGINRVLFDTGGLFSAKADDEFTRDAQRKKPRVPLRHTVTGKQPFVRFVGDPQVQANEPAFHDWARVVANWIQQGLTPYVFLHHPDDSHAPALARLFQECLHRATSAVPAPAPWPCETKRSGTDQLELFS